MMSERLLSMSRRMGNERWREVVSRVESALVLVGVRLLAWHMRNKSNPCTPNVRILLSAQRKGGLRT